MSQVTRGDRRASWLSVGLGSIIVLVGAGQTGAEGNPSSESESRESVVVPPDPFAHDYRRPVATELGTTAGQIRSIASLGVRDMGERQMLAHGTLELMSVAILGIRFSSAIAAGSEPSVINLSVGPSLHLLPYRRIDISAFFEAGPARFSLADGSDWSPMLTSGIALDVSLSSYWFARLEVHGAWSVYVDEQQAENYRALGATLGIGLSL